MGRKPEQSDLVCWNSESLFLSSLENVLVYLRLLLKSPLCFSDLLTSHRLPLFCKLILKVGNFLNYVRTLFGLPSTHLQNVCMIFTSKAVIWTEELHLFVVFFFIL